MWNLRIDSFTEDEPVIHTNIELNQRSVLVHDLGRAATVLTATSFDKGNWTLIGGLVIPDRGPQFTDHGLRASGYAATEATLEDEKLIAQIARLDVADSEYQTWKMYVSTQQ